jgi:hypothetical protein
MNHPPSIDGGLVLAAILISILLLPISVLFLSPAPNKTKDETAVENPVLASEQNPSAITSFGSIPVVDDSGTSIAANDVTENDKSANRSNNDSISSWRCACEGGFLPPGLFGNMESVLKMGSGQCYHKPAA